MHAVVFELEVEDLGVQNLKKRAFGSVHVLVVVLELDVEDAVLHAAVMPGRKSDIHKLSLVP